MHDDFGSSLSQHMIHSPSRLELNACNWAFNQWYIKGVAFWWRWLPEIFLPLWCHFHNSRENRFATTKPASFSTRATAMYYVTCSLIEMINMLVWVQTWWVCTHAYTHTSTRSQWSNDSYFYPRAKVSLKITTAGLTPIRVCILYLVA